MYYIERCNFRIKLFPQKLMLCEIITVLPLAESPCTVDVVFKKRKPKLGGAQSKATHDNRPTSEADTNATPNGLSL